MDATKSPIIWESVQQQIADWTQADLVRLIHELHDASAANREILLSRLPAKDTADECEPAEVAFFDDLDRVLDELADLSQKSAEPVSPTPRIGLGLKDGSAKPGWGYADSWQDRSSTDKSLKKSLLR